LKFLGPFKWNSKKYTPSLHNQARFHPITIRYLKDQVGARYYAWINPGEVLKCADGTEENSGFSHGGFCYLFHEDPMVPSEKDCYYVVGTAEQAQAMIHDQAK
jgi:hypothetical protein